MDSEGSAAARGRIETERQVLAALCQGALDAETRVAAIRRLAQYRFAEPEHEAVFDEAAKLRSSVMQQRREEMAARMTRAGFPDINLEKLFDCEPPGANEIRRLLDELQNP